MKDRYTLRCAVFLILTKVENGKEYILLQKRYNTGLLDGKFDVSCSGHLEKGETVTQAMIRETREELGIGIEPSDLKYSSVMHSKFSEVEYIFVIFSSNKFKGNVSIMEPDKCNELRWFDINNLPDNLPDTRKIMIENYKNNNLYSEYGFNYNDDIGKNKTLEF